MRSFISFISLVAVLAINSITMLSCSESDHNPSPQNTDPVITDAGTPIGQPVSSSIGASGGSLESADGKLTLIIPAGALSSNTTVSIQPITNNGPQGLGLGYRLMPEGTNFSSPVTLEFQYTETLLDGIPEDFLWVITQAGDGSWNALLKSSLDPATKTVTVETNHFSDWALGKFIDLSLSPSSATLLKDQSLHLTVSGFVRNQENQDEELAPLIPITGDGDGLTPLSPIAPVESRLMDFKVKGWTLNGTAAPVSNTNGSLQGSKLTATYTAPNKKPAANPVAVSVTLESGNKEGKKASYLLTSNISIVDSDLYLTLKVDGETFEYYQYGLNGTSPPDLNNYWLVGCGQTDNTFSLLGSHTINNITVKNYFAFEFENPAEGTLSFQCDHDDGNDDLYFAPEVPGNEFDISYSQRTPLPNGDCNTGFICSDMTITFLTYTGETNSLVSGYFSGTVYEDKPGYDQSCTTPDAHTIEGEFRLTLIK